MFQEIAVTAERAGMHLLFFGDGSGIPDTWRGSIDHAVGWGVRWPRQDMSPFIAAMAGVTQDIGFGLTYSSTFMHPFYVARLLNSLDHVTAGASRSTSSPRAAVRMPPTTGSTSCSSTGSRYERMEEFVDVCQALWDSIPRRS